MTSADSDRRHLVRRLGAAGLTGSLFAVLLFLGDHVLSRDNGIPLGQSLAGMVVGEDGSGVAGASVIVRSDEQFVAQVELTTDSTGFFKFEARSPGRYLVRARRHGLVTATLGAVHRGDPGLAIALKAGDAVTGLRLVLPRGGVISGRIVDPWGRPAPGVHVSAIERLPAQAGFRYLRAMSVTSDDRGLYVCTDCRMVDMP